MRKEIYILEGGSENDWTDQTDLIKKTYPCTTITNLYEDPKKLKLLEEYKPWGIFIGTTGIGHELERKELKRIWGTIEYIPEAIIFASEESAMTYLDIARHLKKHYGTISYFTDIFDGELLEINWI